MLNILVTAHPSHLWINLIQFNLTYIKLLKLINYVDTSQYGVSIGVKKYNYQYDLLIILEVWKKYKLSTINISLIFLNNVFYAVSY